MPALLIQQRVSNYTAWKRVFDEHTHARTANGCLGARVFRNADDPSETLVLLTWDTLVRARLFAQSDDLYESIDRAVVAGRPGLWLLEEPGDEPVS
jgi:hypothetical protein